jgi:hypothetical protein
LFSERLRQELQLVGSIAAEKPYEIGGFIDLEKEAVTATARGGQFAHIEALELYSMYWKGPRLSFHTHPEILLDQFEPREKGKEFLKFPSYIDLRTSLILNLEIAEETPPEKRLPISYEVVLTDSTLCIYKPEEKLVDFLLTVDAEKRTDIVENVIVPNIGNAIHQVVEQKMSFDESVEFFQDELATILGKKDPATGEIIFQSGFSVEVFVLPNTRYLYSADVQEQIRRGLDTLEER